MKSEAAMWIELTMVCRSYSIRPVFLGRKENLYEVELALGTTRIFTFEVLVWILPNSDRSFRKVCLILNNLSEVPQACYVLLDKDKIIKGY